MPAEVSTLTLPGSVEALSHPSGVIVYRRDGRAWVARGPATGVDAGQAFLREHGVSVRVDLRDGIPPGDRTRVYATFETVRLPLPALPPAPGPDRDHSPAILAHAPALRAAAARVGALADAGRVPVVHCQAGADRTGAVLACVLLPVVGLDAVLAEHARASRHGGHPRRSQEIAAFVALLG